MLLPLPLPPLLHTILPCTIVITRLHLIIICKIMGEVFVFGNLLISPITYSLSIKTLPLCPYMRRISNMEVVTTLDRIIINPILALKRNNLVPLYNNNNKNNNKNSSSSNSNYHHHHRHHKTHRSLHAQKECLASVEDLRFLMHA